MKVRLFLLGLSMDDQEYYNLICNGLPVGCKYEIENVFITMGKPGIDCLCVEISKDNEGCVLIITSKMREMGFKLIDIWDYEMSIFIEFDYSSRRIV